MEPFILALRIILAIIFGVAGAAKFSDLAGSRKAVADFDVPTFLVPVVAIVLPTVEIAIAAAFLTIAFSWLAAIAAMLLLSAFTAGMVIQMRRGKAPDCHCFGQLHSEPVSVKSVIRNVVIMVPAAFLISQGTTHQGLSTRDMTPDVAQTFLIGLGVVILGAMAFYLRAISAKQTQIIRRIEILEVMSRAEGAVERDEAGDPHDGLPIGALLPEQDLKDVDGQPFSTTTLRAGVRPSLLFFVSPTCGPCQALLPRISEWADDLGEKLDIIFISSGTATENIAKFGIDNDWTILLQNHREFADLVNARWTPSALLVSSDGRVASHVAAGDSAIKELIDKIKANGLTRDFDYFELGNGEPKSSQSRVAIGEPVPDFAVTAIGGQNISAANLRGKQTLVTFWSPTCPYCLDMIDQIKNWDRARGVDDPDLIIFSDGDEEPHREFRLRSPIVLDNGYKIAQTLGMHGTPSAILVNRDGKFASELAIGAPNIWALIGRRMPETK